MVGRPEERTRGIVTSRTIKTARTTTSGALNVLGAHVYFLNPEMRPGQLLALEERLHFDFYTPVGKPDRKALRV
jgi:hypothetical protein